MTCQFMELIDVYYIDVKVRFSHSLPGNFLRRVEGTGLPWDVIEIHWNNQDGVLLQTHEVSPLKFQVVEGGFRSGSKLACFVAFCMQMPSGADVGTKAFRS